MIYSVFRVSAIIAMNVGDYWQNGSDGGSSRNDCHLFWHPISLHLSDARILPNCLVELHFHFDLLVANKAESLLLLGFFLHPISMEDPKPLSPCNNADENPSFDMLREEAVAFVSATKAPATLKGYAADFADFRAWCFRHDRSSLPATPDTVALYLTHRARTRKTSTLERRLVSIGQFHRDANLENPAADPSVRKLWIGIRREKGTTKQRKNPTLTKLVRKMLATLPPTLLGTRDRALLLIGYAGALRRSEIVGLDVSDLELTEEGIVITIRKSKTDQTRKGRPIGIPFGNFQETCPVAAVRRWLDASGITHGPIFRAVTRHDRIRPARLSDRAVATVVKRSLTAAGIESKDFAGHSLRSGFATMAALAGASERDIQKQTGHKNLSVLRRYIHDGQLFQNNAARRLGL